MSRTRNQWFDKRKPDYYWYGLKQYDLPLNFRHCQRGGQRCNCRKKFPVQINKVRRRETEREIRQEMDGYVDA